MERRSIIETLARSPQSGVSLGAGLRKARFGLEGAGKRGGVRVIFYVNTGLGTPIYLLTVFDKASKANVGPKELATLKALASTLSDRYRRTP